MLVGICTQISGRRCDRASGRVGKVVRDVVDHLDDHLDYHYLDSHL